MTVIAGKRSTRDVNAEYDAGLWVPSYYGSRYTIAKKNAGIPTAIPVRVWDPTLEKVVESMQYGVTEQDLTIKTGTLDEAQAECDRRNAAEATP